MTVTSIPDIKKAELKLMPVAGRWLVRAFALTVLFVASALYESAYLTAIMNGKTWLHLRTGLWILQSHLLPRNGLFSQHPSLPWMDPSWAYDVLLAALYELLGLRALPLLLMLFKIALAIVTFLLGRAGKANFWMAVVLSGLAQYVIPTSQSLPYNLSILFFATELLLLERSRRSGNVRTLYWLPLLFLLWADLHILFFSGLLLLALFLFSSWLENLRPAWLGKWIDRETRPLAFWPIAAVMACSVIATLCNPYTFHLFATAYKTLYSAVALQYFAEMRAMAFRRPQEYLLMLLVMAAFLAMGRRRSLKVFELLALIAGTLVAFRIQRESWMAVLPALAGLSDGFGFREAGWEEFRPSWEKPFIAMLVTASLAIATFRLPQQDVLMVRVSQSFPVKACDFIRSNHLPRPMFNEYSWGSFLTWYLPEYPVAIDSRTELYGDDITENYFKVIAGGVRIDTDPSLAAAQTLLLQRQSGVAKALTTIPALSSQYRLGYSDDVAAVFVRQ